MQKTAYFLDVENNEANKRIIVVHKRLDQITCFARINIAEKKEDNREIIRVYFKD